LTFKNNRAMSERVNIRRLVVQSFTRTCFAIFQITLETEIVKHKKNN
jgi:hypothetical protein